MIVSLVMTVMSLILCSPAAASDVSDGILEFMQRAKTESGYPCVTLVGGNEREIDHGVLAQANHIRLTFDKLGKVVVAQATQKCKIIMYLITSQEKFSYSFTPLRTTFLSPELYTVLVLLNPHIALQEPFQFRYVLNHHNLIVAAWRTNMFLVYHHSLVHSRQAELLNAYYMDRWVASHQSLFPRKLENFQEETLKATTFAYEPFVTSTIDEAGDVQFGGLETRIIRIIAESLNFKVRLAHPETVGSWRSLFKSIHGQWHDRDSPGLEPDGKSDFTFVNFYVNDSDHGVAANMYVDTECLLARLPSPHPEWQKLLRPMSLHVWVWSILTFLACLAFICGYVFKYQERAEFSYVQGSISLWAIIFFESHATVGHIYSNSMRIFFCLYMGMTFVLGAGYSGTLISFLTVPFQATRIRTLEEAAVTGLPCSTAGGMKMLMTESSNPYIQQLATRATEVDDFQNALQEVYEGRSFLFGSKFFLAYNIAKHFTDRYGSTDLYVIDECWRAFDVAVMLKPNSRLLFPFRRKLEMLRESGITNYWIQKELTKNEYKRKVPLDAPALILENVQGPFLILALLSLVSLVSFCAEYFSPRRNRL